MSSASAAKALKAAIVTAYTGLFPQPVLVTYGPEGTYQADDIVEVLGVTMTEGEGPMSPQRHRDHNFAVDGIINCYRGGGTEVQQIVTERALDMLASIADYHQDSGTVGSTQLTLGGSVLWSRLATFEVAEEDEEIALGRTTVVGFTITGRIRA